MSSAATTLMAPTLISADDHVEVTHEGVKRHLRAKSYLKIGHPNAARVWRLDLQGRFRI